MNTLPRVLLALGALALIATYFLPLWRIELSAPQYPEGLQMQIWIDHLTGSIDSINNLNHYIGMHTIAAEMFPEFRVLKYVVAVLIGLGLLAAISGRRGLVWTWLVAMVLFLGGAMADFYRWGYDYGHNLDPRAAIKVEGMTYQPPLIGYKQLLNFEALSMPDAGAWVLALVTLLIMGVLFFTRRRGVALPAASPVVQGEGTFG